MRPGRTSAILAFSTFCACSSFGASDEAGPDGGAPDAGVADAVAPEGGSGPSRGLVLALDFEDTSATAAADSSGRGNDGTVFGGQRVPGVRGNALALAGSDDGDVGVLVPSSTSLDIGGTELTIAFWIEIALPLPARDEVVLGKLWTAGAMEPPFYQYGVELNVNSKSLRLFTGTDASSTPPVDVTPAFGSWVHVAFVVGGGTATGYLNGGVGPSAPMTGPITKRGNALSIGVDAVGEQPFVGKLDEVRIYDRALSAGEIAQLAAR